MHLPLRDDAYLARTPPLTVTASSRRSPTITPGVPSSGVLTATMYLEKGSQTPEVPLHEIQPFLRAPRRSRDLMKPGVHGRACGRRKGPFANASEYTTVAGVNPAWTSLESALCAPALQYKRCGAQWSESGHRGLSRNASPVQLCRSSHDRDEIASPAQPPGRAGYVWHYSDCHRLVSSLSSRGALRRELGTMIQVSSAPGATGVARGPARCMRVVTRRGYWRWGASGRNASTPPPPPDGTRLVGRRPPGAGGASRVASMRV